MSWSAASFRRSLRFPSANSARTFGRPPARCGTNRMLLSGRQTGSCRSDSLLFSTGIIPRSRRPGRHPQDAAFAVLRGCGRRGHHERLLPAAELARGCRPSRCSARRPPAPSRACRPPRRAMWVLSGDQKIMPARRRSDDQRLGARQRPEQQLPLFDVGDDLAVGEIATSAPASPTGTGRAPARPMLRPRHAAAAHADEGGARSRGRTTAAPRPMRASAWLPPGGGRRGVATSSVARRGLVDGDARLGRCPQPPRGSSPRQRRSESSGCAAHDRGQGRGTRPAPCDAAITSLTPVTLEGRCPESIRTQAAEGPDVGAPVDRLPLGLLRAHVAAGARMTPARAWPASSVGGRATPSARRRIGLSALARRIEHLQPCRGRDQDVCRLEIAVPTPFLVRRSAPRPPGARSQRLVDRDWTAAERAARGRHPGTAPSQEVESRRLVQPWIVAIPGDSARRGPWPRARSAPALRVVGEVIGSTLNSRPSEIRASCRGRARRHPCRLRPILSTMR